MIRPIVRDVLFLGRKSEPAVSCKAGKNRNR